MKKLILIVLGLVFLSSCSTTPTKILTPNPDFQGIDKLLSRDKTLKVFMIHGMGDTKESYAGKFVEKLMENNFDLVSQSDHKPIYKKTFIPQIEGKKVKKNYDFTASASIKTYSFNKNDRKLKLYSFYWDGMNSGLTDAMLKGVHVVDGHDLKKEWVLLKSLITPKVIDTGISDLMAYHNKELQKGIRESVKKGLCFMYQDRFNDRNKFNDKLSEYSLERLCKEEGEEDKYIFISISLGSQILFDVLTKSKTETKSKENEQPHYKIVAEKVLQNLGEFYMLSHQIPLIDIANLTLKELSAHKTNKTKEGEPKTNKEKGFMGFIQNYKLLQNMNGDKRKKQCNEEEYKLKIISFIEPNDLLSYAMTYNICGIKINNIQIGNSKKWFGFFVTPFDAGHGIDYLESPDVVDFIITGNKKQ